jgi:hypothetical protein
LSAFSAGSSTGTLLTALGYRRAQTSPKTMVQTPATAAINIYQRLNDDWMRQQGFASIARR